MDYKKILEGVVNIINTTEKSDIGFANICAYIGENCPELRENEDEQMRKWIINYLSNRILNSSIIAEKENLKKAIAWLEKKSEQKPTDVRTTDYWHVEDGEQKPAWSEEDENMLDIILNDINYAQKNFSDSKLIPYGIKVDWFKSLKNRVQPQPKQEWGEEDKKMFVNIKACLRNANKDYSREVDWLIKSIKPQPKNEWSEEDEAILNRLIGVLDGTNKEDYHEAWEEKFLPWLKSIKDRVLPQILTVTDEELAQAKKDAYNGALDKIEYHSEEPTFDDGWSAAIWYLKKRNAQSQNTWKPSDKQMEALDRAQAELCSTEYNKPICDLIDSLNKLREK